MTNGLNGLPYFGQAHVRRMKLSGLNGVGLFQEKLRSKHHDFGPKIQRVR